MRTFLLTALCLFAAGGSNAAAQASGEANALAISATVGGDTYKTVGAGRCTHAPQASIYGVPAALWMVEYQASGGTGLKRTNLTLWRPRDGSGDQLSLNLQIGSSSHRINVGGRGEQEGSGKASVLLDRAGNRLEIKGKDASGKSLHIIVLCPKFEGVEAEGG